MVGARFVLVRHGETEWNAQGRWQGSSDIPLNPVGLAQAGGAAGWFAHLAPVAIWSSPLSRARATAEPVARMTGLPVHFDPRLAEMDFGDFEGFVWEQVEQADPGLWAWRRGEHDCRWGGSGETSTEVGERVGAALGEIDAGTGPGTVLVFSHGTAIRMGAAALLGWDFVTSWALDGMGNCCSTALNRVHGHWRMAHYNAEPRWNYGV